MLYKFKCSCGNIFEDIVPAGTESVTCEKCKKFANRVKEYPTNFSINGYSFANGYTNQSQKELDQVLEENRRIHDKTEKSVVEGTKDF